MSGVRQIIKKPAKLTQAINQDEWILASLNEHLGHTNTRVNKGAFYPSNNPSNWSSTLVFNTSQTLSVIRSTSPYSSTYF